MATAKSTAYKLQVQGLREMRVRFTDIVKTLDFQKSAGAMKKASAEIAKGYRDAATATRDKARANAAGANVPKRLHSGSKPAIFQFSDFERGQTAKNKRSALVGVRTGLSSAARDPNLFVFWGVGQRRRKDNSIAFGGLSMSFAALFERGTLDRRVRPRRYFRRAVFSMRAETVRILTAAYERAVSLINNIK